MTIRLSPVKTAFASRNAIAEAVKSADLVIGAVLVPGAAAPKLVTRSMLATMQRDKKARAGMMRFIVLDEVGKPAVLAGPEEALLFAAYQEVGV